MTTVDVSRRSPATVTSWAEICERHPDEWVFLVDIDHAQDGSLRAARVVGHDRSIRRALDQIGASYPESTVVHTCGRPLRMQRIEAADEIRDVVRARR